MAAPHLLLITMDECRWDALSCSGGRVVMTPAIDRIAAGGTRFTDAFAPSPLCLPSRCSLLTGQYPHRNGAYSNFRPRSLDPSLPNLYRQLKSAGYRIAHSGKCHYAPVPYHGASREATRDSWPEARAAALALGIDDLDLGDCKYGSIWFLDDYSRELEAAGHLAAYRDAAWSTLDGLRTFAFPGPSDWHPDCWTARKATERIERHDPARPLFMWCSFAGPHYPHDPPAEWLDRVDRSLLPLLRYREGEFAGGDKIQAGAFHGREAGGLVEGGARAGGTAALSDADWRTIQSHYFANVALIDHLIGRLVHTAELRFGENLVVIVTSDHGDCMGAHRLWGKNRCAYDEVLRVPLILRGPGLPAGRVSDARACHIDLMPTLLALAGVPVPPDRDGRDLRTSLRDGGHGVLLASNEGFVVAHDRRWKLIVDRRSGISELYDRQTDVDETENRIHDPACLAERERLEAACLRGLMDAALA